MRRIMLMAALAAMLVVTAIPVAFAQDRGDRFENRVDRFNDNGFFDNGFFNRDRFNDGFFFDRNDRFDNGFFFDGNDRRFFDNNNDNNNNNGFGNNGSGVSQSNEQEVQSGDATQSINVSGGGDNSNQCAGVQGVNNTGNATTNTGVLQYANDGSEVEVDDSANFTISPSQTTTCDQQVNQAASASGR